jgi:heme/copper-type cytochrome/quinol oxidase subunit 2
VVTFTMTADLPGQVTTVGTATGDPVLTWSVPLDGTTADLATTSVISESAVGESSGIWGTVATVALVALIAWCVFAIGFIAFVANARRKKARRRASVSR